MRIATRLRAGRRRLVTRRRVVRRKGRRRVVRRRLERFDTDFRARRGRRVRLSGRLANPEGQPLDDATIYIYARRDLPTSRFSALGSAKTGRDGRFRFIAKATTSRVLRFRYPGGRRIRGATREVRLGVPALSSLRVSDRNALNGETVSFGGRVLGGWIPEEGKLVEMQAYFRGRWRTFSTVRSDPRGRWRFPYRFGGTRGRVQYRFRALVPREGGYPFDTGSSRVVRVTVRGP